MMSRITTRFVMAIATAAVAPLLIFGLVSIYSLRAGNRQSVTEGNLNVAHQAAERINLYVQSNVKVLRALAIELRTADLRLWQQDRILKDYVLDFPEFRELSLFAPDERILATSRVGPPRLSVPADYRGDSPRIAPITVDDDFLPTTTVTIPLTRHANRDGWLRGELNLEELCRMVDSIRVGADGFALLVASNGRLIAHGNPDEKARVASGEDLSGHGLVSAVKSQRESTGHRRLDRRPDRAENSTLGLEYRDDRGRQLLGVAAPIPALDWTVIVEQPTTEAYALADQLELQLFVVITLALLATVTLGYYWGRSFIRPIFALMKGTQAIAAGNLDNRVAIPGNDEFHQLGDAFNGMADKLVELQDDVRKQERQAMFGRIAAGLVHDISHPIQNIGNSCKLILRLGSDPEYRDTFRRTVDREFATIKRVLEDLRNLARPMPLERFPVDINRSIKETLDSMQLLAETAGLTLDGQLCPHTVFVEGDVFALGRVYRNLIVNAIEATSPGGAIAVVTEDTGERVRIRVSDTGLGIPRERLGVIFEDFKTTKRRGLGLGLAISRKIVEQLGGTIAVESEVGEGTTFIIEFPKTDSRPFPTAVKAG